MMHCKGCHPANLGVVTIASYVPCAHIFFKNLFIARFVKCRSTEKVSKKKKKNKTPAFPPVFPSTKYSRPRRTGHCATYRTRTRMGIPRSVVASIAAAGRSQFGFDGDAPQVVYSFSSTSDGRLLQTGSNRFTYSSLLQCKIISRRGMGQSRVGWGGE